MVTGNAGAGGTTTIDKDGNVINLTEEEAAAAAS
jgi:hypothetical protein